MYRIVIPAARPKCYRPILDQVYPEAITTAQGRDTSGMRDGSNEKISRG